MMHDALCFVRIAFLKDFEHNRAMSKDPGLVTIISSALFGGLVSSILTQHFFEQRERRKILLNKYEETIESLNTVGDIMAEFSTLFDEVQSQLIKQSSLSDETDSFLRDFMSKFTHSYSTRYLIEINQIELLQCYDNFFNSITERYYQKADFLYQQISDLERIISERDLSNIEICGTAIDECTNLGKELRWKLRNRVKTTMTAPIWQRAWQDVKRIFYWE